MVASSESPDNYLSCSYYLASKACSTDIPALGLILFADAIDDVDDTDDSVNAGGFSWVSVWIGWTSSALVLLISAYFSLLLGS